ncbi:MAG: DUF2339 domain-containing protein, partial [Chloroflexi bacterium]|nr:DUF2339 domain-containing protein [Chloroflexota bacterium]
MNVATAGIVLMVQGTMLRTTDLAGTTGEAEDMKCSRCRKDNSPGAAYCFWCGDRLGDEVEMPRQPASQPDELQDMKQRLRQMSLRLSALERQVKAISRGMPIGECEDQPAPPAPDTPRETPEPPRRVEVVAPVAARLSKPTPRPVDQSLVASALSAVSPVAGRITSTGASAAAAEVRSDVRPQKSRELPRQRKPETPRPRRPEGAEDRQVGGRPAGGARWFQDWEQSLPGNWLSRIGIVALFIGLGFLAKLAYDRDWISPVVQLLTGLSIGVVLLWGGQHWNRRYRVWAQALTGGGVATLYLSFFASYALHDLMPFLPTFVLMFFVTVGAVAIALRQNSMAIAIIGIAGAFLVPIVLGASDHSDPAGGSGGHSPGLLIAYILLLDAGIVWLSSLRNWRWFTLLGWTGSLLVYGLWYLDSGREESLLTTLGGLTGIFVCFALATMLFHVVWRRTPGLTDLALMSLNAAVYFSASYFLMWDDYRGWLGTFSFMLAGLYGLLAWLAWWRSDSNRRLCQFAAGIAIVFLTIAIPIQFHRAWITVAWAAEGAVLTWIATRQSIPRLQLWALGVFGLVLVRLFAFDNVVAQAGFRPVMDDDRFVPFAMSILAFYAAAYFLRRDPKVLQPWLFPMMVLVGCFLTVWLLSADIVDFAGRRIIEARLDHSSHLHIRNLENARALALALTWTVYGLCLVAVGVWRKWGWLRVGGYVLVAAAVGMTVVLLNHVYAGIHRAGSTPILNYSFGAFAVSVFGLYLLSFIIANNRGRLHGAETAMFPVLMTVA